MCDPVSAITDFVSSAGDTLANTANDVSQFFSPQYGSAIGPGLAGSPDIASAAGGAGGAAAGVSGGLAGLANTPVWTGDASGAGSYSPMGSIEWGGAPGSAGASGMGPATGAPISSIAAATPSIATSPVGAAGGGGAFASAAPGTDLGSIANQDTISPTTAVGDAQQYGSPIGPGLPSSPGGAPPDAGGGLGSQIKDFLGVGNIHAKDLIGPALATGGLALNASKPQALPFTNELQGSAQALAGQGSALTAGLQTGTLPAGLQASIDEASAAQKAHIRSQYAGMGLSGSTMEQQALNQVDSAAEQQKFQQIAALVSTGLGETSAANSIYQQLQKDQLSQDASLSDSISKFAAALAAGGRAAA